MGDRHRSRTWVFWALLAVIGLAGSVTASENQGSLLLGGVLCGLYATYLYRGGRFVILPIPGCLTQVMVLLISLGALLSVVL